MLLRSLALIAAVILSSCSAVPTNDARPQTFAGTVVQLDSAPGKFRQWRTSMYGDTSFSATVSMPRLRPHKDWGPLASACIHGTLGGDHDVCVRVFVPQHRQFALLYVDERIADEWVPVKQPSEFARVALGADLDLKIEAADSGVSFHVNGERLHRSENRVFSAFSFTCSSAVCQLRTHE